MSHLRKFPCNACNVQRSQALHAPSWEINDCSTCNGCNGFAAKERRLMTKVIGHSASAPAEPRHAPPDRRIRAWAADDRERQEQERFERKPTREQLDVAISAWCARFRRPNDPDIERTIGRQGVGRDLTEAAMSHLQVIEDPRDPRIILRPQPGLWSRLKEGLAMQYAASKFVRTDPKAPVGLRWWQYIRDLQKDTR